MKNICFMFIMLTLAMTFYASDRTIFIRDTEEIQLIRPEKVLEGPDRSIYIYDSQDAFFKVFSPEGKFIRKFGGKGEGPGQIKRPEGLDFGFKPGTGDLYFTEFFRGHHWITLMDPGGKLRGTLKYNFREMYGVLEAVYGNRDRIFIQREKYDGEVERNGLFYAHYISELITIDHEGNERSLIRQKRNAVTISLIRGGGDSPIPFIPGFLWVLTPEGEVIFTEGNSDQLEFYTSEGKLLRKVRVPVPPPAEVTGADLDKWRKGRKETFRYKGRQWYNQFGIAIEKYKKSIYRFKPSIGNLSLTPGGNILLDITGGDRKIHRYVVSDTRGKLLLELSTPYTHVFVSENYVFLRDNLGEDESRIGFIRRSSGELEDLKKLEISKK